jgi:hypothetical protein
MDTGNVKIEPLDDEEEKNPWEERTWADCLFYNCLECKFRTLDKNSFSHHLVKDHPKAATFLDKNRDGDDEPKRRSVSPWPSIMDPMIELLVSGNNNNNNNNNNPRRHFMSPPRSPMHVAMSFSSGLESSPSRSSSVSRETTTDDITIPKPTPINREVETWEILNVPLSILNELFGGFKGPYSVHHFLFFEQWMRETNMYSPSTIKDSKNKMSQIIGKMFAMDFPELCRTPHLWTKESQKQDEDARESAKKEHAQRRIKLRQWKLFISVVKKDRNFTMREVQDFFVMLKKEKRLASSGLRTHLDSISALYKETTGRRFYKDFPDIHTFVFKLQGSYKKFPEFDAENEEYRSAGE